VSDHANAAGPLAAVRGAPSHVWRAGQERRLAMIARWATLRDRRILEVGCGLGMYTGQYRRRFTPHVEAFDVELARVTQARGSTPHALVAAGEGMP